MIPFFDFVVSASRPRNSVLVLERPNICSSLHLNHSLTPDQAIFFSRYIAAPLGLNPRTTAGNRCCPILEPSSHMEKARLRLSKWIIPQCYCFNVRSAFFSLFGAVCSHPTKLNVLPRHELIEVFECQVDYSNFTLRPLDPTVETNGTKVLNNGDINTPNSLAASVNKAYRTRFSISMFRFRIHSESRG